MKAFRKRIKTRNIQDKEGYDKQRSIVNLIKEREIMTEPRLHYFFLLSFSKIYLVCRICYTFRLSYAQLCNNHFMA